MNVFVFSLFIYFFLNYVPLGPWIQIGRAIGFDKVKLAELIFMSLKKIPVSEVANAIIYLHKAGIDFIDYNQIASIAEDGGNISESVDKLIAFHENGADIKKKYQKLVEKQQGE